MSADAVIRGAIDCPAIIGKLPAHGDFIARGVEYSVREPLDRWMSGWIELSRERLGDGFTEAYETAAPWLFEGTHTNAVLMPSVDAVGRIYPMLAVCDAACRTQVIYDTLIAALEQGMKGDALRDALTEAAAQTEESEPGDGSGDWFLPEGAEKVLPSPSEAPGWG
ncbi:MAG: type VI secretion system-associated protein TagF, partial [Pseudomonadota bacterium]